MLKTLDSKILSNKLKNKSMKKVKKVMLPLHIFSKLDNKDWHASFEADS